MLIISKLISTNWSSALYATLLYLQFPSQYLHLNVQLTYQTQYIQKQMLFLYSLLSLSFPLRQIKLYDIISLYSFSHTSYTSSLNPLVQSS